MDITNLSTKQKVALPLGGFLFGASITAAIYFTWGIDGVPNLVALLLGAALTVILTMGGLGVISVEWLIVPVLKITGLSAILGRGSGKPPYNVKMGERMIQARNLVAARRHLQRMIEFYPREPEAYFRLLDAVEEMGIDPRDIRHYQRKGARSMVPKEVRPVWRERWEQALEVYDEAKATREAEAKASEENLLKASGEG